MTKEKVIFFGNGPLADYALEVLEQNCQIVFHAHTKEDLEEVKRIKTETPEAHGVLASFGVIIRSDVLDLFEPEGILNIHPSLLPQYRGASPIESAILAGDDEFGVSVMKLAPKMDAGPIYAQAALAGLPLEKDRIYREAAKTGAKMVLAVINDKNSKVPTPQDDTKATFCGKLDKAMGLLTPEIDTAEQILRKIIAFQGFPKPKYAFFGLKCIVLEAHMLKSGETAPLVIPCLDKRSVAVDLLQPEGRKPMDAISFINGYKK